MCRKQGVVCRKYNCIGVEHEQRAYLNAYAALSIQHNLHDPLMTKSLRNRCHVLTVVVSNLQPLILTQEHIIILIQYSRLRHLPRTLKAKGGLRAYWSSRRQNRFSSIYCAVYHRSPRVHCWPRALAERPAAHSGSLLRSHENTTQQYQDRYQSFDNTLPRRKMSFSKEIIHQTQLLRHTLLVVAQVQTIVTALDGDHTSFIPLSSAWQTYKFSVC